MLRLSIRLSSERDLDLIKVLEPLGKGKRTKRLKELLRNGLKFEALEVLERPATKAAPAALTLDWRGKIPKEPTVTSLIDNLLNNF
jgi:hypothetical protein